MFWNLEKDIFILCLTSTFKQYKTDILLAMRTKTPLTIDEEDGFGTLNSLTLFENRC